MLNPSPARAVLAALLLFLVSPFARAATPPEAPDLNPVTMLPAPRHEPVVLVRGGVGPHIIVTPSASGTLREAVTDLAAYIKLVTGAEARVEYLKTDGPGKTVTPAPAPAPGSAPAIIIGSTPGTLLAGLDGAKMPVEGFAILTAPGYVYIAGNDAPIPGPKNLVSDGTAWGVYEFCERFLGVRWYYPDPRGQHNGDSFPKLDELVINPVSLTSAPFFRKREIWPSGGPRVETAGVGVHHRRLRSADTWPARVQVHAPHDWATLFQKSRPEIFQLRSDGQRDFSMLCYGNPRTLATYLEQIDAQVKYDASTASGTPAGPDPGSARIVNGPNITVSPADLAIACRCDDCRKLWDEQGGQYGDASNILATFVQKLSVEVKNRWPDKTIVFLPYKNYTRPPRVGDFKFAGNVEVQICGMPGLAQYKEPAIDKEEQANIDGWMKISGRKIQNWHYDCWPEDKTAAAYHYPHVIQAHYLANLDKTVGSFINGEGNHWPRQNISLYIWMKLLWNPNFNVDAAIDEYCARMFGPASATMRELVKMQCDGWEKSRWPEGRLSAGGIYNQSFPRAEVKKMEELFAKAQQQAATDERAKVHLEYIAPALLAFFAESKDYSEGTGRVALEAIQTPEDPVIDGKLDDACWKKTEPAMMVRALDEKQPKAKFPTEVRAVWSRQGVTFGFRMVEPNPEKMARTIGVDGRDSALMWWDDNVELFLDVEGKRNDYYQWIINANGAIYDGHRKDNSWNGQGVRVASFVGSDFWSTEVYIPYAAFQPAPRPNTGAVWFGNFTRHRVTDRSDREIQRLNTTFAGPSNNESAFGPIKFIER